MLGRALVAPSFLSKDLDAVQQLRRDLESLRETWSDAQKPEATAEDYRRLYDDGVLRTVPMAR